VLLLTDGQANQGVTDPQALIRHAAELTEAGIATTTLGYGEDFHEELLAALADAGRGNAYHVETADQAPAIFAQELEGLLATAAQNVRLQLIPTPAVRGTVRLRNAVPHRQLDRGLEIALGDLYSAEERRLLVELDIPAPAVPGPLALAEVHLAYDAVAREIAHREQAQSLGVEVAPAGSSPAPPDPAVLREALLLGGADVLLAGIHLADEHRIPEAREELKAFLGQPEVAGAADPELEELRDRIAKHLARLEAEGFSNMTRKTMFHASLDYHRHRRRPPRPEGEK
jgi:Ca-activated chloride channel family protein